MAGTKVNTIDELLFDSRSRVEWLGVLFAAIKEQVNALIEAQGMNPTAERYAIAIDCIADNGIRKANDVVRTIIKSEGARHA